MHNKRERTDPQTRPIREAHRPPSEHIRVGDGLHRRRAAHRVHKARVHVGHRRSRAHRSRPHRQALDRLHVLGLL